MKLQSIVVGAKATEFINQVAQNEYEFEHDLHNFCYEQEIDIDSKCSLRLLDGGRNRKLIDNCLELRVGGSSNIDVVFVIVQTCDALETLHEARNLALHVYSVASPPLLCALHVVRSNVSATFGFESRNKILQIDKLAHVLTLELDYKDTEWTDRMHVVFEWIKTNAKQGE